MVSEAFNPIENLARSDAYNPPKLNENSILIYQSGYHGNVVRLFRSIDYLAAGIGITCFNNLVNSMLTFGNKIKNFNLRSLLCSLYKSRLLLLQYKNGYENGSQCGKRAIDSPESQLFWPNPNSKSPNNRNASSKFPRSKKRNRSSLENEPR